LQFCVESSCQSILTWFLRVSATWLLTVVCPFTAHRSVLLISADHEKKTHSETLRGTLSCLGFPAEIFSSACQRMTEVACPWIFTCTGGERVMLGQHILEAFHNVHIELFCINIDICILFLPRHCFRFTLHLIVKHPRQLVDSSLACHNLSERLMQNADPG